MTKAQACSERSNTRSLRSKASERNTTCIKEYAMTNSVKTSSEATSNALRYSIFTVHDHYPEMPRTVAELYQEAGNQCVLAERLGYDGFFVAEHHFASYGSV